MLGRLKFLLTYFIGWVTFFELGRLLFVLFNHAQAAAVPIGTACLSFWYGLRMDLSISSYLIIPVCLMVLASVFLPFLRRPVLYRWYTWILLFFALLLLIADLGVYQNWGFRLDATPLKYLKEPKEAWASISHLPLFWIALAFLAMYVLLCFLSAKWINRMSILIAQPVKKPVLSSVLLLVLTALLIIPVRGGLQQVPLNQSSVYFSKSNFANMAAINPAWNFLNGIWNQRSTKNPYHYLEPSRAAKIVDSLYASANEVRNILNTDHPNVVIVIWESFTQKATETKLNGIEVTPGFNALKKEGVYFNHIYASGDRTDKGLAAVLSGYPALNNFSILYNPAKATKLPTLGEFFKDRNYQSAFYYGGEPEFANMKSYILQAHYDHLVDKSNFHGTQLNSKWGAHDGVMANRILQDLDTMHHPFFATWLTLTSHEPFEIPEQPVFGGNSITIKFLNSLHYTDKVLYDLVDSCKTKPWWKNTLFIIIADHGHPLPEPSTTMDNFRIPMLWLGGALKEKGISVGNIASQIDLATTLTKQLAPSSRIFPFSKNILDSTSIPWAYFSFQWGFGFVEPSRSFIFDNVGKQLNFKKGSLSPADINAGKAMQQFVFADYLAK